MENADNMENLESGEIPADEVIAENDAVTGETEVSEAAVDAKTEEDENNYPSQTVLTIRAIVGGYVLYLAYQIITSENEVTPLMWAAVVLFIVAGAGLIIMSIKHFICKEYK